VRIEGFARAISGVIANANPARQRFPIASRESSRGKASPTIKSCPVNSGAKPAIGFPGHFFRLGIPEDSLILGHITGADYPLLSYVFHHI